MNIITCIAIGVLVPLLLNLMIRSARKAEKNFSPNDFCIRQPRMAMWIGIICFLVFLSFILLMVFFPNDTVELWIYVTFSAFSLLGAYLAYYCIVWNVTVHEDTIVFTTVFRKSRSFTFYDITEVRRKSDGIAIFCGEEKVLKLETNCVGYQTFVNRLISEGISI